MDIFPNIDINLNKDNQSNTLDIPKVGRSFLFDFKSKRFIFNNGKNVNTNSLQAIEQWIHLVLITYKDKFEVYKDTSFYCNIEDLIGTKPSSFAKSELIREIKESLSKNNQIDYCDGFNFTYENRTLTVNFTVYLKDKTILNMSSQL